MRFTVTFALLFATAGFADTLTLRSGQVITGTYLGGTSRTIKMEVGDAIQNYDVSDIASLQFTAPAPAASAPAPAAAAPPPDNPPAPPPDNAPAPPPDNAPAPPPDNASTPPQDNASTPPQDNAALGVEIPAGTEFTVRMIDSVDSETNSVGQTFQASMDEPVIINGETIIPRGADVVIKLVDNKESGKLTGTTQLALNLASVRLNGNMVNINTQSVTKTSSSRGSRTAKMAGGGAALGAIIGAIAGGGKGAAIGAGAGAAAGTGAEVATKGQKVHIPSETRLTFVTDTAVRI